MANELTPLKRISNFMNGDNVQNKFEQMLGKRAPQFISSVMSAVNSNALLQNATPESVYGAAIMAATLDLPVNGNLGFAYIVPFNCRKRDAQGNFHSVTEAQFQLGSKGFIQLAQRSGQYKSLTVNEVYEGELTIKNRFTEEFEFGERTGNKVVGYLAYFKLNNGFEKYLYMTVEEIQAHGKQYSKTYGQANGVWTTNFDAMAKKTIVKRLLSKYGILSIEMQQAQIFDQAVVSKVDTDDVQIENAVEYVDNDNTGNIITPAEESAVEAAKTAKDRVEASLNKQK